jgi:predicted type IV restriction endonuclease
VRRPWGIQAGGQVAVPDAVLELVERFSRNREQYLNSVYNETQVRREFLDPFFKALGWDVDNAAGNAPQYREVIHEDAIKIGLATRAPDYSFRVGSQRKFFVEAKKPAVNLQQDASSAFQLRRYAWSAKLPLSILTDFQEFVVYDCRVKPAVGDKSSAARTIYIAFEDYEERWDEIAGVFSKAAVYQGSFDKYAESTKAQRGTAEVDKSFLGEIEGWRDSLARSIALRNSTLSQRELNYAVQATIDRIIFLRICEDRGIETYGRLQGLLNGAGTYGRLKHLFFEADQRYDSGLFHFEDEQGRPGYADRLTLGLTIDDSVLKDILRRLYYPESPYEFSVLPADILGQVYEQFLGKVIRLTPAHRAVVEDKPEVKKAGGVYYTPTYVVDYIVESTLGPLLDGLTPKRASELRILDPACGSGSFLIGAYQYLLDWHRDWYVADAQGSGKKHSKALYEGRGGEWRLTGAEKRRILLNSIFGVDIDTQAVETTKLSLLLKVLEGETSESLDAQLSFMRERALPDLGGNIKCGNSLIGPDFYDDAQLGLAGVDEDERYRINVFDWESEFSQILGKSVFEERRGFDVVIGNPPYIFTRELLSEHERRYFGAAFRLSRDKHNTYVLFMEALLGLLAARGRAGFIVPNSWLTIDSARVLRVDYARRLLRLADLNYQVFRGVAMEPCVFIVSGVDQTGPVEVCRVQSRVELDAQPCVLTDRERWQTSGGRIVFSDRGDLESIVDRILAHSKPLGEVFDVRSGLQAYERGRGIPPQTATDVADHVFDRPAREGDDSLRYLQGKDVQRHGLRWSGMWMQYGPWLSQPREQAIFIRPRVLLREITADLPHCLLAVFTSETYLNNKSILNVLHSDDDSIELLCLAGVLNSKATSIFYKATAVKSARRIFPKVVAKNLAELPYPVAMNAELRLSLAQRVTRVVELNARLAVVNTDHDRTVVVRELAAEEHQLDRAVYALFGLTDDDIALIET